MGNNQSTTSLDEIYLAYGESSFGDPEPLRPVPRRPPPRFSRLNSFRRPQSVASDITAPLTPSDERYPYPILEQPVPKVVEQSPLAQITPSAPRQIQLPPPPPLVLPAPRPTPILLPAPPILLPPPPPRSPILLPAPPPKVIVLQPPSPVSSLTDTLCEDVITEPLTLSPVPAGPPTPPTPEQKPAAFMELTPLPSAPWYCPEPLPAAPAVESPLVRPISAPIPIPISSPILRPISPPILKNGRTRGFSFTNTSKKVSFTDVMVEEFTAITPLKEMKGLPKMGKPTTTMTEEELEQMGMKSKVAMEKIAAEKVTVEKVIVEEELKMDQPVPIVPVTTVTILETTITTPPAETSYFAVEPITKTPATELFHEEDETPTTTPPNDVVPAQIPLPLSRPGSIRQEKILSSIQEVDEPIMHLPSSPAVLPRSTTPMSQISFSEFKLPPLTRSATFAPPPPRASFEAPVLLRSRTSAPTPSALDEFRNPQQPRSLTKTFTMKQVSRHSTPNDLWVVVGEEVFDCTDFAATHPGGAKILNNVAGKDATKKFDKHHPRAVLDRFRAQLQIGVVDNTISDGASIMSRSSRNSFSRGKSFLGKLKFGKKNKSESDGIPIMPMGADIGERERRGSM